MQRDVDQVILWKPERLREGGARLRSCRVDLTYEAQRVVECSLTFHVGGVEPEIALAHETEIGLRYLGYANAERSNGPARNTHLDRILLIEVQRYDDLAVPLKVLRLDNTTAVDLYPRIVDTVVLKNKLRGTVDGPECSRVSRWFSLHEFIDLRPEASQVSFVR